MSSVCISTEHQHLVWISYSRYRTHMRWDDGVFAMILLLWYDGWTLWWENIYLIIVVLPYGSVVLSSFKNEVITSFFLFLEKYRQQIYRLRNKSYRSELCVQTLEGLRSCDLVCEMQYLWADQASDSDLVLKCLGLIVWASSLILRLIRVLILLKKVWYSWWRYCLIWLWVFFSKSWCCLCIFLSMRIRCLRFALRLFNL